MPKETRVSGTALVRDDGMIEMRLSLDGFSPAEASSSRPRRTKDFGSVNWFGTIYSFEGKQRIIVAALWDAMEQGSRWVSQSLLLEAVELEGGRVAQLFKKHPAWGVMIVPAILHGGQLNAFGLGDPPE